MSDFSLSEVRFCAEECERQRSGEMSVFNMLHALAYARQGRKLGHKLKVSDIVIMAGSIEPTKNRNGYRTVPVRVGDEVVPVHDFSRLLAALLESDMTPNEKYYEFQKLHPFVDGNGRVGAILYNIWITEGRRLLSDTWHDLRTPPTFDPTGTPVMGV